MKLTLKRDLPLLLAALLVIWGLWYARPIGVETLYPELEPDIIEVYLSDFTTYRHEDRRLKLTAGTELRPAGHLFFTNFFCFFALVFSLFAGLTASFFSSRPAGETFLTRLQTRSTRPTQLQTKSTFPAQPHPQPQRLIFQFFIPAPRTAPCKDRNKHLFSSSTLPDFPALRCRPGR